MATQKLVKRHRTNIAEQKRIVEIAAMLLNLQSKRYIVDYLVNTYGIKERSCDYLITRGYEYIRDNYKTDRESIIIKHLEFYYDVAREWKAIDPRASLKAMEQIEKLLKLHQDMPLIQQNTMNLNFDNVSDEQLLKAIETITKNKNENT
jgi:hypothetical protein